jgi:putative endonuclease
MSDPRRALGAQGEDRAARYLERRGWRIEDRNVRSGGVEMDIVASRGATVAFVEVKTRSSSRHGPGFLAVDERKQARIITGAQSWLQKNKTRRFRRVRFDVITCHKSGAPGETWRVDHWPNAFDLT